MLFLLFIRFREKCGLWPAAHPTATLSHHSHYVAFTPPVRARLFPFFQSLAKLFFFFRVGPPKASAMLRVGGGPQVTRKKKNKRDTEKRRTNEPVPRPL